MRPNVNVTVGGVNNADFPRIYKTKFVSPKLPFATQIDEPNTKYVIKHNFDLGGETVTVPENCILEFDGGSLKNGTIIGQDTVFINVGDVGIWGEDLTRQGTWKEIGGAQSDWNQTDPEAPDYIKNKPAVYTKREADNKFQPKGRYAPASDTARIEALESAVGTGGSVDTRIAAAKSEIIGDAASGYDTLGEIEDKLESEQSSRIAKDNQHDEDLSNRYTKEETNNIISRTPETDVIVIDVPAASQSNIAAWLDANTPSGTNPETGRSVRANKLYRVPGPDNTTFSEWAWDGAKYIMLANKDYGIDNEPIPNSANPLGSGAAASTYGYYVNNPEYLRVYLDKKGRILDAISKDGHRIKDDYKVDKEDGKGLIDSKYASANRTESSPEFFEVFLDSENRIITSISKDGQVSIPKLASPKIDALANEINALTEKLQKSSKGAGNYIDQKKYALNVFRNTEAGQTFYRKEGNIWVNENDRDITINPITDHDAADPSYIQVGDYFYLFKTGRHCSIDRSKDLVNWEENYSQVFPDDFDYSIFPNFVSAWANDINCIDGRYVDYIAIWGGDNNKSYTIVMYATDIEGPWTYGGVMCPSKNNGGPVSQPIDPEYVTDGVNGYLIVGCFRDLYMAQTSVDGLHIVGNWFKIARGIYNIDDNTTQNHCGEGSYVYKYKGYYYLFVSLGRYGDYTYRVAIARSRTLDASFVNKDGENLLNADATVILHSDEGDTLYGPGHNGEIYEDGDGNMYMILHCHVRGMFSNEQTRPAIMMRIVEGDDGWLAFADMDGNVVTKPTWATGSPVIV